MRCSRRDVQQRRLCRPRRLRHGPGRPAAPPQRAQGDAVRLCRRRDPVPALFAGAPDGPFSLNLLFDRAIEAGRFYGLRLEGVWMHVGTPQAIAAAERAILAGAA
jgi:hypothetical protein